MTRTEEKFITIVTEQLNIHEDEAYDYLSLFVTLGPYAHKRIIAGTWRLAFIADFAELCKKQPKLRQQLIVTLFPNSWDGVVLYRATSFLVNTK